MIGDSHLLSADVIGSQDFFQMGHCFWRERTVSAQDPNIIYVEKPDDRGTGVHEGIILIVGGQDPVWGRWHH